MTEYGEVMFGYGSYFFYAYHFIRVVPKTIYLTFVGGYSWRLDPLIIIQYPDVFGHES